MTPELWATWHKFKSRRKEVFEKAIKELNEHHVTNGRKIALSVDKGLYDYVLVARLETMA